MEEKYSRHDYRTHCHDHTEQKLRAHANGHTLTAAISHDAQKRTYQTRQAGKIWCSPWCRNQAAPLLPASPVLPIRWQRDWAARTPRSERGREKRWERMRRERERGREKEGGLYSAPRSHAQIIVNAAQKASRLDIRFGKQSSFRTDRPAPAGSLSELMRNRLLQKTRVLQTPRPGEKLETELKCIQV